MPLEDDVSSAPAQPSGNPLNNLGQYKWFVIGGVALIAVFILMRGKSGTSKKSGGNQGGRGPAGHEGTGGNIDPATGSPYGSSADIASLRTYGALGGGAKYNMGASPKAWGSGRIGLGGGFMPPYEPLSDTYYHGLATPSFPVGPAGPPGPGNTGATGDNFADILSSSQALTTASTIPIQEKSYNHTRVYRVKPGDNLAGIAAKFGVAGGYPTLFKLNQHTIGPNPDLLIPGTLIYL